MTAVLIALAVSVPAVARASDGAINGVFRATSNGDWAKTNEVFIDEASTVSTWSVTSSCVNPIECSGEVASDQGWTAELFRHNEIWYVKREVPKWQPCPDGTTAPGKQTYMFYPIDVATGQVEFLSTTFTGKNRTAGSSGACGINKALEIELPFFLVKIG